MDSSLLTTQALRDRGWTPSMISKFLGEPDKLAKNPYYRSGPPMKLYSEHRIEAAEKSPDFAQAATVAANRSKSAMAVSARKRKELIASANTLEITVAEISRDTLLRLAIDNYNNRRMERDWDCDNFQLATPDSDPCFLIRIQVNYIRHCLTKYDHALEDVAGKVGVADAVQAIRRKVYLTISTVYPWTQEECRRQMRYRDVPDTHPSEEVSLC